jgi:hypothetical protein
MDNMLDPKSSKIVGGKRHQGQETTMIERRESERVPLTLAAELIELRNGSRITGRLSDSSRTGCYVDSLNCYPAHTPLRIRLIKGAEIFEADGKVVYSRPGLGMGILFTDISTEQQERLHQWMAEGSTQPGSSQRTVRQHEGKQGQANQGDRFGALLQLLVDKNIITQAEARKVEAESVL